MKFSECLYLFSKTRNLSLSLPTFRLRTQMGLNLVKVKWVEKQWYVAKKLNFFCLVVRIEVFVTPAIFYSCQLGQKVNEIGAFRSWLRLQKFNIFQTSPTTSDNGLTRGFNEGIWLVQRQMLQYDWDANFLAPFSSFRAIRTQVPHWAIV